MKPKEVLLAMTLFVLGSRRKDLLVWERVQAPEPPVFEDITLTRRGEITLSMRRFAQRTR